MTSGILSVGTDGSCLRNPNGPTGWAYICDDGRYSCGGRVAGTNQIGELMAILAVLRDFTREPLQIQSDSAYAIGCASTWKPGWQRAGYVRKTGPIANLDIIREIHQRLDSRDAEVRFVKVKAHLSDETVHPLNVRATSWPAGPPEPPRTAGATTWSTVAGTQGRARCPAPARSVRPRCDRLPIRPLSVAPGRPGPSIGTNPTRCSDQPQRGIDEGDRDAVVGVGHLSSAGPAPTTKAPPAQCADGAGVVCLNQSGRGGS